MIDSILQAEVKQCGAAANCLPVADLWAAMPHCDGSAKDPLEREMVGGHVMNGSKLDEQRCTSCVGAGPGGGRRGPPWQRARLDVAEEDKHGVKALLELGIAGACASAAREQRVRVFGDQLGRPILAAVDELLERLPNRLCGSGAPAVAALPTRSHPIE